MFWVSKNLEITLKLNLNLNIKYMEIILIGTALKQILQVILWCKESARGLDGDKWNLVSEKSATMEQFQKCSKMDRCDAAGEPTRGTERCSCFDKDLWFELGNIIWRKNRSIFKDHVKYIHYDIVKTFRVGILC